MDFTQSCDGTGDYGTVTVDQPALLDAHDGSGLSIQSCGDGGPHIDPPGGSQQILTELQPGTVFLTATSNDPPWRATLGPVLPGGASCPVVPFPLPPLDGIVAWTFAARAPTETLWLSLSSPLAAAFFVNEPVVYAGPDSTDVYGCTDCSGASCVELSSSQAAALSVGALRIDPTAPAADGFIYARIGAQVPTQP